MKETQETQKPGFFRNILIWTILISLGAATYYVRSNFPPAFQTSSQVLFQCPQDISSFLQYKHEEFNIQTNPIITIKANSISPDNNFVVLEGFPVVSNLNSDDILLDLEVSIFAVDPSDKIIKTLQKKEQVQVLYNGDGQAEYAPKSLGQINNIEYENYIFVVKINNGDKLQQQQIHDLRLASVYVNSSYTQNKNLTLFKWLLFAIALVSLFLYRSKLSKLPEGFSSSEQRKVSQLAFLLLPFTQPLGCYFEFDNTFWYRICLVIVVALQGSVLVSLWFNLLEKLASSSNSPSSANRFRVNFFSAVHFVALVIVYGVLTKEQIADPVLDYENASMGVNLCKYYAYVFVGVTALWSLVRLVKVLGKIRDFDWRDSSALLFTFYYMLCYMFFIVTGNLQLSGIRGSNVVLFYGITTLYTVLLQVLYSPFGQEVEESEKRRKYANPDARNQYDDLDMSDMGTSKKDNIELRSHDASKKQDEDYETEGVEI